MTDVSIKTGKRDPEKKVHEGGGQRWEGMQPQAQEDWKPPETVKSKEGPFSGAIRETRFPLMPQFSVLLWTPKLRQFGYLLLKPIRLVKNVTAAPKHWHRHTAFPPDWQLYNLDSSPYLLCRIFLSKDSDTLKTIPQITLIWNNTGVHLLKWLSDLTRLLLSHFQNLPITHWLNFSLTIHGGYSVRLILPGCSPKPLYFHFSASTLPLL